MPIYEYHCAVCGPFWKARPVPERDALTRCPDCGAEGRREFTTPNLGLVSSDVRRAHAINERSAHRPEVRVGGHTCSSRCGCGPSKSKGVVRTVPGGREKAPMQSRRAGARPWMLGHS